MNDPKHNTLPTVINPLHYQLVHDQQHMIGTCPVPLLEHGQLHIYFHVPEMTGTTRPLLHTMIIFLINIVLLLRIPLALGREASRPSIHSIRMTIRMHAGTENVSDNTLLYRHHALHILLHHRQPLERDQENICTTILSMTARDRTGIGLRMNQITVRFVLARARILRGRRGMKLKEIDVMTVRKFKQKISYLRIDLYLCRLPCSQSSWRFLNHQTHNCSSASCATSPW